MPLTAVVPFEWIRMRSLIRVVLALVLGAGGSTLWACSAQSSGELAERNSRSPSVRREIAQVRALLREDRWREALVGAEAVVEAALTSEPALLVLAEASWRAGQLDRTRHLTELLVNRGARLGETYEWAVHAALAAGARDEAERIAALGVRVAPDSGHAWLAVTAVHATLGELEEARRTLQRAAIRFGGTLPQARAALRRVEQLVERVAERGTTAELVDQPTRKGREEVSWSDGRPVVPLAVSAADGGELLEVPMLVDTGGSRALAIDRSLEPQLSFQFMGTQEVAGVAGPRSRGTRVRLDALEMGAWRFEQVPAVLFDLEDPQSQGFQGIVGPVLFADRVLIVNLRRRAVALKDAKDGAPSPSQLSAGEWRVPFWLADDGKVLVQVGVGVETWLALVDTGAVSSACSAAAAREGRWGVLQLGDQRFELPPPRGRAGLDENVSPSVGAEVSLLLGMDFWSRFGILTFDFQHHTLTLTPRDEQRR